MYAAAVIAGCPARVQRVVSFVENPSAREELYGNATGEDDGVEDAGDGGVGSRTSRQRELVWSCSEGRGRREGKKENGRREREKEKGGGCDTHSLTRMHMHMHTMHTHRWRCVRG